MSNSAVIRAFVSRAGTAGMNSSDRSAMTALITLPRRRMYDDAYDYDTDADYDADADDEADYADYDGDDDETIKFYCHGAPHVG